MVVNRNRAKFARFKSIIMKKLLYISLLAVLLSAAISCSRSVDKRLVLADTLMWTRPDSSLAYVMQGKIKLRELKIWVLLIKKAKELMGTIKFL